MRVLIGSTFKMGAGTNVQDKLIALHDLDRHCCKIFSTQAFTLVPGSSGRVGSMTRCIGSTFKMGAGTNVQDKLIALHDLDCPWRPRDLTQRKGRIERRGNDNEQVHVYRYVTEATFEAPGASAVSPLVCSTWAWAGFSLTTIG